MEVKLVNNFSFVFYLKNVEDKGKSYSPSRSSSGARVNSRENKVRENQSKYDSLLK